MKNTRCTVRLAWWILSLLAAGPGPRMSAQVPASGAGARPSFVVILGEGAGWTAYPVRMDDATPASPGRGPAMPGLERLAAAGLRFSAGYAASPRCTPSRAALFTGRSPAALHMTFVGDGGRRSAGEASARVGTPRPLLELPEAETTVAELLRPAGYATAHFGKWHVGRASPARHGFDESDGPTGNGGPENVANPNPKQALAMTERGVSFLERQAAAGRPFYLQLSHYPSQEERGRGGGGGRRTGLGEEEAGAVDGSLVRILEALDRLKLAATTYVVFTTDHGSPGRNAPLAGGKGGVGEGGIRVPFIVAGPGVAAGGSSPVRVTALDLLPTVAELAGLRSPLPAGVEGGSLAAVLRDPRNGVVRRPREEFVVHFPHYDKDPLGPASAILLGDLKLIRYYETGVRRLFDVARDVGERQDLAGARPEKAEDMDRRLTEYLQAVGAQLPEVRAGIPPGAGEPARRGGRRPKEGAQ